MQVGQLLPLRLLRCSTSLFHPSLPMLRRAFPFKLKYCALSSTSRAFSYRTSGMHVRAASGGQGARSLIDDEAELSDWVSDLKESDIIRSGIGSGSEDGGGGGRGRGRDFGKDIRGGGDRTGMLNSSRGVASKRRREGVFGSGVKSSRRISSKFLLGSDEEDDEEEEDRRPRGARGSQMRSSPSVAGRGRKDSDMGRFSSPIAKRGERTSEMGVRKSVDGRRKPPFGMSKEDDGRRTATFEVLEEEEEEEDDDDDDEFGSDDDDEFGSDDEDVKGTFGVSGSPIEPADGNHGLKSTSSEGKHDSSYLSQTRFDQCSVSPLSLKAIKAAGYERLTQVQEATLPVILKGKDVLAKARTGTGKTIGFLLPAIEIILKQTPVDRDHRRPPIYVLIICPTRELANQAAMEATALLKFHPNIGVQFVTGGTRLALEQKRMQANPCQILVATPGRLRDHTENTPGFATRLMGVKVLVLDEADHLLDMGFRKDIEKIIAAVPKQRQTLLFSATVPEEVRQVCHIALRRDHEFINTVAEGSEETHSQVAQMLMVAPLDKHFSLLYHILQEHIRDDADYKVLVFCTTAMVTRLVAGILSELKLNVREIHSRKPQSYRTRVSDEFRKSKGLILVTSDVSARGVDYPDVTLVMQIGVPSDREQYIHRLGRTGRKGKEGQGILLLAPWEDYFTSTVKDLPISNASLPHIDPETRKKVDRALAHVEMKSKEAAYQAWLGYYNSNKKVARDKHKLVELANEFSRSMGLDSPPAIPKLVLGKMGLKNVPGLRSK